MVNKNSRVNTVIYRREDCYSVLDLCPANDNMDSEGIGLGGTHLRESRFDEAQIIITLHAGQVPYYRLRSNDEPMHCNSWQSAAFRHVPSMES